MFKHTPDYLSRILYGVFACAMLLCTSCSSSTAEEEPETPEERAEKRFSFLQKGTFTHSKSYETVDAERVVFKSDSPVKLSADELKKLESPLITKRSAAPEKKGAAKKYEPRFYDDFIALNGDEEVDVSLVFNSAKLVDVLSAFADILGFNFIADNDINMSVTINLNSKMTRRELWASFDRMVKMAHCSITVEDSVLRIIPTWRLQKQPGLKSDIKPNGEILLFPLESLLAREALQQIRGFTSQGATVNELTRTNAILICDNKENIAKINEILTLMDRNNKSHWPRAIISCGELLPSKVVNELQEILPVLGFNVVKNVERTELPGSIQLIGLDRLKIIVAAAATEEAVNTVKEWVKLLDVGDPLAQERVFVYKVRHNKAHHLAQALATIYDTQGASLTIDTSTGRTRLENVNSARARTNSVNNGTNITPRNNRTAAANVATPMETDKESTVFKEQIKVFADGQLNRLVIRSTPHTYASIKALLDRLDVVPAQVLLQVLVVEVTLSENTQFGVEFSATGADDNTFTMFGTNYANDLNPFSGVDANGVGTGGGPQNAFNTGSKRQNGATFVIANPKNPNEKFGYIRALAGDGLVKVISSPQLLVSSHTEASITVGKQIPIITSGITNTSSSGSIQQNYQYLNTGVILTVTPQVTSTDLIAIEVKQEISTATKNTTSQSIDSPEINQRIVETNMTIANGQTMVIGGLIHEEKNDSLASLPVINQIPILNRLLGNTDVSVSRSEVLVMITGHIVNEHSPVEEMIGRYNDAIQAINDFNESIAEGDGDHTKHRGLMTEWEFWK